MEWIKKHWKEIIIVLLLIFGMNKCTQSCNRNNEIEKNNITYNTEILKKDSIIKDLNDSISVMNVRIQVYEEKISGLSQALSIQDEANRRISEAKKNINVNVKTNNR